MNAPQLSPRLRAVAKIACGVLAAAVVVAATATLGTVALFDAGRFGPVPTEAELREVTPNEASLVLDRNGQRLGKYYVDERVEVAREELAPVLVAALVATEDARFYRHGGIDFEAWARVAYRTVLSGDDSGGGGSTLSQQLVKNLYPRVPRHDDPTVSLVINKLRESIIATRIERLHDKDDILVMYLNTVPFPDNIYGIGVAARRYFDKSPAELSVGEAATLVASLKATYDYDPLRRPAANRERRDLVLALMAEQGYISAATRERVAAAPTPLCFSRPDHDDGIATYFRESARLELRDILAEIEHPNGRPYDIYRDGLTIQTTIDAGMQAHAETAVREHLAGLQDEFYASLRHGEKPWEVEEVYVDALRRTPRYRGLRKAGFSESAIDSAMAVPREMTVYDYATAGEKRVEMSPADSVGYYLGILNSGFLAVEPGTGAIRAWVGGPNHEYFKYDKIHSRRSVGSTFKPIVYAAALQQGIDPCRYWGNYRRTYARHEYWSPRNAEHNYGGSYNMRGALTKSLNTISAQLIMKARPDSTVALAHRMGISADIPPYPSIALGAAELSLHDMIQAYSVFANRGARVPLRYIERITDREGRTVYEFQGPRDVEQVLERDHADLMRGMLEGVVDDGTGRRLRWRYKLDGAIAGKTGTSQNHSDGWFIGFTPGLLAGVWTGAESPAVRFRSIKYGQGAHLALPIFGTFMQSLSADRRYEHLLSGDFPEASALVAEQLDCPTRYYAPEPTAPEPTAAPALLAADAPQARDGGEISSQPQQTDARAQTVSIVTEEVVTAPSRAAAPPE